MHVPVPLVIVTTLPEIVHTSVAAMATFAPGEVALIPTNAIVKVPEGHVLLVALRSSTPRRKGLLCPNGVGVIDQDYCGPEDEIQVQVLNFSPGPVTVERGERIAQGLLMPVVCCLWDETGGQAGTSRGGFGSTNA